MIEIKDECVHCKKGKQQHSKHGEDSYYCNPPSTNLNNFKSVTEALAEKNGLKNLELLIEIYEAMRNGLTRLDQESGEHSFLITGNFLGKLSQAIKESTEHGS